MPFSLIPDRLFDAYDQITPELLRAQGITLLLSDLDFTLAEKKTRRPPQALRDWLERMESGGIEVMIVSNNRSGRRVDEFCAELVCTAMLGDKLLTDVLAARRAGVLSLMVEPVGGAVTAWQKVLHALQAPFKAACRRKMSR